MKNWEEAFEDWVHLLQSANAEDLLKDPKTVWDEAWRHVAMRSLHILEHSPADASRLQIASKLIKELINE